MKKNKDNKCTIFTLSGFFNYGNRLQLFALAKVLNKLGFKVTAFRQKDFKRDIKEFIKYNTPIRLRHKKEVKLRKFTKKYVVEKSNSRRAKYSIVGSDQVWNPYYLSKKPYFLNVPNNSIKISYAASISRNELSREDKNKFKQALKDFKAISVREKSAKELLQPLTKKNISVVLDPTLLLCEENYIELEKKPKSLKKDEKYVLCYVLGTDKRMDIINAFAAKNGYKVILFSDKNDSEYGIEEFLYLIHHAALIYTDSFHACVFSFIFERPFVVFRRTDMFTRLQNLIDTFNLQDRGFNGKTITKQNVNIDYTEAKKILEKEREKSLDFLKTSLGVKDESR